MKNSGHRSRAGKLAASTAVIGAMSLLPVAPALAVDSTFPEASISAAVAAAVDTAAATEALAATPWRTTGAVDQDGAVVDLADARAAAFVGDAYFKADGTFAMYELSGAPKMHGLWEMREVDGKLVRWIRALDDAGATRFERIVEIVRLDGSEFTYRVSNADDASQWVDIVHTPMSDPEPGTVDVVAAAEALAATPWRTTGAVDQDGAAVDLADARAAAFVGDAYFKADGTFAMYELSGAPKMHGLWEMREVDGKLVRWIRALDDAGATRFERIVEIVRLDGSEFTYRVSNADDASQWVDIVHTPMSDPEPGTETGEGDIEDEEATEDETVVEDETPAGGGTGTESGTPESGATDDLTGSATDGTPTNATTTSLPNTGGLNAMSALAGSIVAVLSGAAVLIGRAIRRRTN